MNKFASRYGKYFVFIGFVFLLSCNEKKVDIQNENSQKTVFSKFSNNDARFIEISEEKIKILDFDGQMVSEPIDKKDYFAKGESATLWKDKNSHLAKQWERESICKVLENEFGLYAFQDRNDKTKYGFEEFDKNVIIPATFDNAFQFSSGVAAVKKDGKWGYINNSGKALTDFSFDDASSFSGFLATVKKGEESFLIELSFKKIMKLNSKYNIRELSSELAVLEGFLPNKPAFLIAKSGSILVDEKRNYYKIYGESDGLIRVMKNNNGLSSFGFINIKGEEVIPSIYEIANDFVHGIAAVKTKKGWSVINSKGKNMIPFSRFENISVVDAKALFVSKSDGKYALLKIDSESEIEMGYKKVIILKKSALLTGEKENGQKEIVNTEGKNVLNMSFDEIIEDSDGILRVESKKKWGFLNTNQGSFFVKPIYEKLSSFKDDRALAVIAGQNYIINSNGETVKKLNDGVLIKFINDLPFCR
ncbi:MAG TPA: WG repeat-containing protein [bacterium]|nr:WG repeat-containing protein [bacterium]